MAEAKRQLFPIAVIAKVLELTERRVYQLAKEGIVPRATSGKYDLIACVQAYIRYLRAAAGGGERLVSDDIAQDKARLVKAQAEAAEMVNAERRGELVSSTLVIRTWERVVTSARGKFLAYFDKVPHQIVACSNVNEIREVMRREGYEVLEELANADYSGSVADDVGDGATGDGVVQTTAGTDRVPMGGQV